MLPAAYKIAEAVKESTTATSAIKELANKLMYTASMLDRTPPRTAGDYGTPEPPTFAPRTSLMPRAAPASLRTLVTPVKVPYNKPVDTGNLDAQRAWTTLTDLSVEINEDKKRISTAVERGEGLPDEATQAAVTAKEVRFNVALADFKKKYITFLGYNATRSAPKPLPIRRPDAEAGTPRTTGRTYAGSPDVNSRLNLLSRSLNTTGEFAEPPAPTPKTSVSRISGAASAAAGSVSSAARTAASGVSSAARTAANSVRSRLTRKASPLTSVAGPLSTPEGANSPLYAGTTFPSVDELMGKDKRDAANKEMEAGFKKFRDTLSPEEKRKFDAQLVGRVPGFRELPKNTNGYKFISYADPAIAEKYRIWSSRNKRGGSRRDRKTRRRN